MKESNWQRPNPRRTIKPRPKEPPKPMRERKSVGVACCQYTRGNAPTILMVKKRFTYAFDAFVHGRYSSDNSNLLINLFSKMTVFEKHDILSLNFQQIWYRLYLTNTHTGGGYFLAKNKFENTFVTDGGLRLKRLIGKAGSVDTTWEIPKGRKKNSAESDIHCAVREFAEETGIPKKQYRLLPANVYTMSHVDENIKYTNVYFLAMCVHAFEPCIRFDMPDQINEIGDIKWMNMVDIRAHAPKYAELAGRMFSYIKRRAL